MKKLFCALMLVCGAANASSGFTAVPSSWKLESYSERGVALWFTPSTCNMGSVGLPATATVTDHNRLYATVMAAKISGSKMFIYYDVVGVNCVIVSYGMAEQ
ncbi:hypothetical protein [Massilia sp. CF038]|uniref:hypothetical protein n=1 Tax=Massilia sp. CF038 TaxID=1881045 RepID=UPI00091CF28B|nr:hypothetical protein [Massilia sp. CF038]SHG75281.1 hypothetical protein SAMN05428948_1891 [Massilia sp. CF038]